MQARLLNGLSRKTNPKRLTESEIYIDLHINGAVTIYVPSPLFVESSNAFRYISSPTPVAINVVEVLKALHLKVVGD